MTSVGFYPGCSLNGSSREYNESVRAVAEAAGLVLEEVPDWNCCGATAAHNLNREISLALPARILANAENAGIKEILVPCAACYNRLALTRHELQNDTAIKKRVQELTGAELKCDVQIINVLQWLEKFIVPELENRVNRTFSRRVACYYGCLLVRPAGILKFDRPEDPVSMDRIMQKLGATAVEWAFKTECCGAGFSISNTEAVGRLSGEILRDALLRQAEVIIVACPMCHSNLDMRRPAINAYIKEQLTVPVIYITQAVGLAMGIGFEKLGLHRHFIPVSDNILQTS